jgi:acetyl-CoA synthetase
METSMSEVDDKITSLLSENRYFEPPPEGRNGACVGDIALYRDVYRRSLEDTEGYWSDRAKQLVSWYSGWETVLEADLRKPGINWFKGATLNVSYNCLDRHIENGKADKTALIWQGEPEDEVRSFTYRQLHEEVCRCANVLKKKGVR